MKHLIVGIAALFIVSCAGIPAVEAQQRLCGDRDDILKNLERKYGESPIVVATTKGKLVEVLTNPETHTWTIIATTPNGPTCLVANGKDWYSKKAPKGGEI